MPTTRLGTSEGLVALLLALACPACPGSGPSSDAAPHALETFADQAEPTDAPADQAEPTDAPADADVVDLPDEGSGADTATCDLACPERQHCERSDAGARCVDNVCTGGYTNEQCEALGCACLPDGSCGDCFEGCEPPCDVNATCEVVDGVPTCVVLDDCFGCPAGTHCGVAEVCWANTCQPPCALGEYCAVDGGSAPGDCVAYECNPACASYEYCDAGGQCQPYECDPACPKDEHCGAPNVCVPNECNPPCDSGGSCGHAYCDAHGICISAGCFCGDEGPTVCALVGDPNVAFETFANLCDALCCGAIEAPVQCDQYPTDPVCDVAGYTADPTGEHTYDNLCFAQCAGKLDLAHGACECSVTCTADELESGPVCGMDCQDYANLCDARCAWTSAQYPGTCQPGCACCSCYDCADEPCPDPVCSTDGQTYASLCEATLCHAGVSLAYAGACVPTACNCPTVADPVCGSLPATPDAWETLASPCAADCLGASVWYQGVCPSTCCDPRPEAPVCAHDLVLATWSSVRNACVAYALPYIDVVYPGACVCCDAPGSVDGCCDLSQGQAVCGVDGVMYANECALSCAGVAKDHDGPCP